MQARDDRVTVEIVDADPTDAAVVAAVKDYAAELTAVLGRPFRAPRLEDEELAAFRPPLGTCLLATIDGGVVGTTSLRTVELGDGGPAPVGEVKRMWVALEARGLGVGRALLDAVHARAEQFGMARLVLDTEERLRAARGLYESVGYAPVAPYNDNPDATHYYELVLEP